MKQNITRSQYQELSEEQLNNLCKLANWDIDRVVYFENATKDDTKGINTIIDIGRMIEILNNPQKWLLKINQSVEGFWRVELDEVDGCSYYRNELCDALWEAVKSIL